MHPIDFFYKASVQHAESPAVEWEETQMTYSELREQVDALAAALQTLDPTPQSRVGICAFNHLEHLIAWLAVLAAEKIWVPLYPKNNSEELRRAVEFTEASIVIADTAGLPLVEGVVPHSLKAGSETKLLRDRFCGSSPIRTLPPLSETQAIKFTGGTTGKPKAVQQPYRAWNINIATQISTYGFQAEDRFLTAAPITHGTSTYLLPTLAVGGTVVLTDRPKPADMLCQLRERKITTVFLPPTVIYMMLDQLGSSQAELPTLRRLIYGAGPMRPTEIERAQRTFGPVIASTYGQTEAPQIATYIGPEDLLHSSRRTSVGRSTLLTRVEVMNVDGEVLPPGQAGEVVIRGDLVMTGYWRQPEKTAETLREGWLHTGDIGVFDEDGFLYLKGRLNDVVITGGFNVYPSDIEPILREHPAIREAALFGVPNYKWGEAVHVAVELHAGATVTAQEIIDYAKKRVGPVKAPKAVAFYDQLPRNAYGKLQRQILVADAKVRGDL